MEFDVFLYTRDKNKDYSWKIRPEYLDSSAYSYFRDIENVIKDNNMMDQSDSMLFLYNYNCCGMIARILKTSDTDSVGRKIYSFEGLCINNPSKADILEIPNILLYMYGLNDMNLRKMYYEDNLSEKVEVPSLINVFDKNTLNYIYEFENPNLLSKIIYDILEEKTTFSICIGKQSRQIFEKIKDKYSISKFCDIEYNYDLFIIENKSFDRVQLGEIKKNNCYNVGIIFKKYNERMSYRWVLINDKEETTYSKHIFFDDEISLNVLKHQYNNIMTFLNLVGENKNRR